MVKFLLLCSVLPFLYVSYGVDFATHTKNSPVNAEKRSHSDEEEFIREKLKSLFQLFKKLEKPPAEEYQIQKPKRNLKPPKTTAKEKKVVKRLKVNKKVEKKGGSVLLRFFGIIAALIASIGGLGLLLLYVLLRREQGY